MTNGTAKKARFKSAARADTRDDNKIDGEKKTRVYLDNIIMAAMANTEHMQEMTTANKSKDD